MEHTPERSMVPPDVVALVISRAAELEQQGAFTAGDSFDERAVVDIGEEVGLTPAAVREALAEYQAGLLQTPDAKQQTVVGPRFLVVERTVPGPLPPVDAHVEIFLKSMVLECSRRVGGRSMWRARRGALATIQRAGKKVASQRTVDDVTEVIVNLVEVPAAPGHPGAVRVRFEIECRSLRQGLVATTVGGSAISGAGAVAATTAAVAFSEPVALLGLPVLGAVAAGTYLGSRMMYRRKLAETALVFEGALDGLGR
jgi:hypothetical protein